MLANKWLGCALLAVVVGAFASQSWAEPIIAYENTTNPGSNFNRTGQEMGNRITLEDGTPRMVTRMELKLDNLFPTDTFVVIVRIYANDGMSEPGLGTGVEPGTVLFESPPTTVGPPASMTANASFSVLPNITVPDSFTWTIQRVDDFGGNLTLRLYAGPPSPGSDSGFIWERSIDTNPIGSWSATTAPSGAAFFCIVEVEDPSDPITLLTELVTTVMNLNLQNGIANSLDAKIDAAIKALDDMNANNDVAAVNTLEAFINAVMAQSGDKISVADADALIAAAQTIIDLLLAG